MLQIRRRTIHSAEPAVDEKWIAQAHCARIMLNLRIWAPAFAPLEVWMGAPMDQERPQRKQNRFLVLSRSCNTTATTANDHKLSRLAKMSA